MRPTHVAHHPQGRPSRGWRRFLPFFGERPLLVAGLAGLSFAAGICESALLALIAQVAATLVTKDTTATMHAGPIHLSTSVGNLLLAGLAIALVRMALQWPLSYLPAAITSDFQANLRRRLFRAFTRASWSVQSRDSEGEFQDVATSQVIQATLGVIQATALVTFALMLSVLVAAALFVEPLVALVVMGAAVGLFLLLRPLNAVGSRHARALSRSQLDYAAGVHEAVSLAEEIHVFGTGEAQMDKVDRLIANARHWVLRTGFLARLVPGSYQGIVLLLLVGGLAVLYFTRTGGLASLGAVVLLLVRASTYGQQVQGSYHLLHQQLPFLETIARAEQRYRSSNVVRGDLRLARDPSIVFDDVSFAYEPNPPVLRHLSFVVAPGEAVGVVGPSGAGKSTLVQLLLGLRAPQSGMYAVEGKPPAAFDASEWTRAFAYVPQDPRLLHATVADNIRFFRPLDDAAVEEAARQARIHEEILTLPNGYETTIGQRADALSGGQRQRICLARALAGHPLVLVLDEPTSALDPRSETLVQESLAALRGRVTLFVVAHRMSTLKICDKVMVLLDGRLDAFAPSEELVSSNTYYKSASMLAGLHFPRAAI